MKSTPLTSIAKKLFTGIFFGIALLCASQVHAFTGTSKADSVIAKKTSIEDNATISYIGEQQEGLLFNVTYNNISGKSFTVFVKDEAGNILYQDYFNGKNFNKKFLLLKGDLIKKISFSVTSKNIALTQDFNIDITSKVVENVIVSRN
jgi:hypothetical protein